MISFQRLRILYRMLPMKVAKLGDKAFAIERARSQAEKCTASITGMPHGNGTHSQTEDGAIKIMEMEDAYREVLDEISAMCAELEPLIDGLPMYLRPVMRLRYEKGYTDQEIADAIDRSLTTVERHRRRAEKLIEEIVKLGGDNNG